MIYFDKAATTKPCENVINYVKENIDKRWGNPSALYDLGIEAKQQIEEARRTIAELINAKPSEIFFTSGSTEGLNWFLRNCGDFPVYTSPIEHHAILNSVWNPQWISLDKNTVIKTTDIPEFAVCAMSYVNNEIGTILPVKSLMERHAILMLDATQAFGHIPIDVIQFDLDFMVCSAHKFGGLKGCGFMYVSEQMFEHVVKNYNMQYGGAQEMDFRAGTENTLGIIAMGIAAKEAYKDRKKKNRNIEEIRNYLYGAITNNIKCAHLNGTANWQKRWCGNLNFRFDGYRGEELQAWFNMNNVCVSTGSACNSNSGEPSHVLKAIGLTDEQANSSLRFSFDENNGIAEAKQVYKVLQDGLEALKR